MTAMSLQPTPEFRTLKPAFTAETKEAVAGEHLRSVFVSLSLTGREAASICQHQLTFPSSREEDDHYIVEGSPGVRIATDSLEAYGIVTAGQRSRSIAADGPGISCIIAASQRGHGFPNLLEIFSAPAGGIASVLPLPAPEPGALSGDSCS